MKKLRKLLWLAILPILSSSAILHAAPKGLDIYFIDVEGGAATLIVTPAGQSLLIDTGFPCERDAGRIAKVALEVAGLKQIDHCVITHWHRDHVGGVPMLAKLIPIRNYYDHGLPQTLAADLQAEFIDPYKQTTNGASVTLKPGDEIKLSGSPKSSPLLKVRVVAASGMVAGDESSTPQIRPCGENFEAKALRIANRSSCVQFIRDGHSERRGASAPPLSFRCQFSFEFRRNTSATSSGTLLPRP
jgi:beta-lactamase superfamily II metal-dependent hydrolase